MRRKTVKRPSRSSQVDELPVRPIGEINRARSWVVYGRSGTGKTTLAATFPKPILYLDIKDEGTDSINDVEDIDVMDVSSKDRLEEAYWWLTRNPDKYKTVVLDTVSQLQQIVVDEFAAGKRKRNTSKRPGEWGSLTKQDWGEVAGSMKEWLVNYRDLARDHGMQVLFIAQDRAFNFGDEEDESSEETPAPNIGPALSPSVARTLNAAVSVIVNTFIRRRIEVKEVRGKKREKEIIEYCLGVGPSALYTRKVRKPKDIVLPDLVVNPTYEDLLEIIKGDS